MSGIARPGTAVRVLGEGYSLDDEEDQAVANISEVFIAETRYTFPQMAFQPAASRLLLGGVDNSTRCQNGDDSRQAV